MSNNSRYYNNGGYNHSHHGRYRYDPPSSPRSSRHSRPFIDMAPSSASSVSSSSRDPPTGTDVSNSNDRYRHRSSFTFRSMEHGSNVREQYPPHEKEEKQQESEEAYRYYGRPRPTSATAVYERRVEEQRKESPPYTSYPPSRNSSNNNNSNHNAWYDGNSTRPTTSSYGTKKRGFPGDDDNSHDYYENSNKKNPPLVTPEHLPRQVSSSSAGSSYGSLLGSSFSTPNMDPPPQQQPQQQQPSPPPPRSIFPSGPPSLRIQFANNRLEKYNKPLTPNDVVMAPSFFGEPNNKTMFYDLRQDMEDIIFNNNNNNNNNYNDPNQSWRKEFQNVQRECLIILKGKCLLGSRTCNGVVVKRIADYFELDPKHLAVSMALRRGKLEPFFKYEYTLRGRNVLVVASFGATREAACLHHHHHTTSSSSDNSTSAKTLPPVRLQFPQPNNTVMAMGGNIQVGWQHGTIDKKNSNCTGDNTTATTTSSLIDQETITVLIRGHYGQYDSQPNSSNPFPTPSTATSAVPAPSISAQQQRSTASNNNMMGHETDNDMVTKRQQNKCFHCGKFGHRMVDCWYNNNNKNKHHNDRKHDY